MRTIHHYFKKEQVMKQDEENQDAANRENKEGVIQEGENQDDAKRENKEGVIQEGENQDVYCRGNKEGVVEEGENQDASCSITKALHVGLFDYDSPPFKYSKIETSKSIVRDPGLRRPMWEMSVKERDEVRRAYINIGPYQPILHTYPVSDISDHPRKFQASWFQSSEVVHNKRLKLQASVDVVRWLVFQACAFRGNDESSSSSNQGNFIEFIKVLGRYNDRVAQAVLDNAPKNAKYTSPKVQKEILHVFASKVRAKIIEEIGDAKYCIIIDEARDESNREQMVVLRFVNNQGQVQERFLDVVHVRDITAKTLKNAICTLLSQHNLSIQDIRGQGYDGASNMRGEWNGLQTLMLNECPYAHYVHCFAHRLQLALVAASKEVVDIHNFFEQLTYVINVISASSKHNDELHEAQAKEIVFEIAIDELGSGRGLDQIDSLQRPVDTRWGSHFLSVCSLIKMFGATCVLLENLRDNGSTYQIRGEGNSAYKMITSFDFVFILHLVQEILGHSDTLCQTLQRQGQDILNAMSMVDNSKGFLQELRETGWDSYIDIVEAFCRAHDILIPDMDAQYFVRGSHSLHEHNFITVRHHYHVNIFIAAIDSQLAELNSRFNEHSMEILRLMSTFDPRNQYELFNEKDAYTLAHKFYPEDFAGSDLMSLKYQLKHYKIDICHDPSLQNLSTISEVCQALMHNRKNEDYPYVFKLLNLILTLPVYTATTERAFSAIKLIKTRLRNKMEDEFFADCLLLYIEKDIGQMFDSNDIIDAF